MADLSERKQKILSAIVEQYIATGEPVGSKALAGHPELSVSSATVRNEMAELASMGYLDQPHTSAGRVPTEKAYRYYIDNLMERRQPDEEDKRLMDATLKNRWVDPETVLEQAGELLAEMTNYAAVSTTPADEQATISRVELVPMGSRKAMLVLLTSTGVLKSRLCRTETALTPAMVESFYHIVGSAFLSVPVCEISMVTIQTLAASLGENALAMTPLLITLAELARDASQSDIILEGETNLLNHRELDMDAAQLLGFLQKAHPIANVAIPKDGLRVIIGRENPYKELENSSFVVARYNIGENTGGSLGIIGPVRMNYERVISNLEYITALVGKFLSEALED